MKYIYILLGGVVIGVLLSLYFVPEREVIKYKDKLITKDQVVTETKYITKNGETKIVTVTNTQIKEIEKEKEVIKYDNKKWIIGAGIGIDSQPNKYIQVDISRNIISNLYLTIGTASSLDTQVGYLGVKVLF